MKLLLPLSLVVLLPACTAAPDGLGSVVTPSASYRSAPSPKVFPPAKRKIRKEGSLSMKSRTLTESSEQCVSLVETHHGILWSSSLTEDGYEATIRVPASSLKPLMDSLSKIGRVTHRRVDADDVTEQYLDLEAKIHNTRALRNRLRQLLERSESIKDTLHIEKELARVQTELDQLEGRLKRLHSQVALSTLNLSIERETIPGPLGAANKGAGWVLKKLFVLR